MSQGDISIAPATRDELTHALLLLDHAAQWLNSIGIRQWESPPPAAFVSFMRAEVDAGRVFLAKTGQGALPIATFRLASSDMPRWQDDGRDNALYVYSLAIRNDLHGQGAGAVVLRAIRRRAAQQARDWLRLDCLTANSRLRQYYQSLGFAHTGDVLDSGFPLSLYEVRVSSGNRPSAG